MKKAKLYYNEYKDLITSTDDDVSIKAISDLYNCLLDETKELITKRKAKTNSVTVAIIKEENDKWNAICRMFEKDFGMSPIAKDGFINMECILVPDLKKCLEIEKEKKGAKMP